MLQKLRSRHPIDLPDRFGHKKGILTILGGLFALFVLVPFLISPLASVVLDGLAPTTIAIGAAVIALLAVLILTGLRGKPGWNR